MSDEVIVTITEVAEEAIIQLTEVSENVVVTIQEALNGEIGLTGPAGTNGTNGTNGGSTSAWNYNAKTNATSGYPGDGYLLWNNATQTSATSIIVSHLTDDDTDIELFLSFFVVNQKIFIQDRDDSSKNQVWLISGTPTVTGAGTATAYYTFPVTLVSSAGGAFTNNHSILFGQISVATNSVTSATTSDGTCVLSVSTILASGSITTSGIGAEIYTTANDASITTSGDDARIATYGVNAHIQTQDASSAVKSTNFAAYETTGASLKTSAGTSIATFGVSGQNFTFTSGTALTFDNTSFTYGTGAEAAHRTALGVPSGSGTSSGTNTGDQTTIVGITGTLAEFNTALTGADFATLAGSETLTNKTLTSPAINSATFGTAATFNATSYTFGTGAAAAMNQSLGTSSVDSRISSLFSAGFQFAQDDFLGRWLTFPGNNAFNWLGVGSASLWSDAFWQAVGFPGGTNLATNNNAFFYYMSAVAAANIANFNEVVFDHVFSPNTLITLENIFVGIRNTASATAEVGRRGLYYEAGVDTNWQLLHETSAGVKTKVDTGKLVVINQIVRVTIKFVSATQTDMIIATSTNTTPVTVSATSGFSCTGSVGLGFWLRSTTAANRFMLQMRSTLAWPTSTL
jgi:hypothetical protein